MPIFLLSLLAASAFAVSLFWYRMKLQKHVGMTSSASILLTFFIGAMVASGLFREAVALSVVMFALLFTKKEIVGRLKSLHQSEIVSAAEFGILAFVIYPFLPDKEYFFINIKEAWMVVIIVSLISFAGYLAMRRFGEKKGTLLNSVFGSVFSSTAVVVSLAHGCRRNRRAINLFAAGAMLAAFVMLMRNIFIASLLSGASLLEFAKYAAIVALYIGAVLYFLEKRLPKAEAKVQAESPFAIKPALYFGLMFSIILIVSKLAISYTGSQFIAAISFFAGMASGSAAAASAAVMFAGGNIGASMLANSIIFAGIGAMLVDIMTVYAFGERRLAVKMAKYQLPLAALLLIAMAV